MKTLAIIEDGNTLDAYIAEREGLHPAVSVTYRPMIGDRRARHNASLNKRADDAAAADRIVSMAVVDCLHEWDVTDAKGNAAEINLHNVHHLQPMLRLRLYNLVMGVQAGDIRDDGSSSPSQGEEADIEAAYKAEMAGESPETFAAKN